MALLVDADGLARTIGGDDVYPAETDIAVAAGEPEVRHFDAALSAQDAQDIVLAERDAAGDFGDNATGEMQQRGGPFVDAGLAQMGGADHLVWLAEGLSDGRTGNQPDHRGGIAADIENTAAGEIVGIEPVLRHEARHGETEARLDHPDLADDAGPDQLHQLLGLQVQPVHEGFAEECAGLARGMHHGVGLEGGQRQRLFAQHMLSGLGRLDRPLRMAWMRYRNVDGVDVGVGEQRVVAVEDTGTGKRSASPGLAGLRAPMATSLPVPEAATPPAKDWAMLPGPRMPQRMGVVAVIVILLEGWKGLAVSAAAVLFRRTGRICGWKR